MKFRKTPYLTLAIGVLFLVCGLTETQAFEVSTSPVNYTYYECTYAKYPEEDINANKLEGNPVFTNLVCLDIKNISLDDNPSSTEITGSIPYDLWIMDTEQIWDEKTQGNSYDIDTSNYQAPGTVEFIDAEVTEDNIIAFFSQSIFFLYTPDSMGDDDWTAISSKIQENLESSYGTPVADGSVSREGKTITVNDFGPGQYYTLTLTYNDDLVLEKFTIGHSLTEGHVIFQAELLEWNYSISPGDNPESIWGKDWYADPANEPTPWWEYMIVIVIVAALVVVLVVLWKKRQVDAFA